jgi:hypothetical protein
MRFVRLLIAIMLVPLAGVLVFEFFKLVLDMGSHASLKTAPFWAGFIGYFIFQAVFFRPMRTYVFGHELTHAFFAILSGAKVKKFRVGASGGSVELTKSNVWITLAPYFVPIYATLLTVAYWLAGVFYPMQEFYPYFMFGVGFTLSFHFSLTHYALKQGQSDLEKFGVFFSGVFILIINCVFLAVLLRVLFPENVSLDQYFRNSVSETALVWKTAYFKGKQLCYFLQASFPKTR